MRPIVIAIAGGSGSGKSTLARNLAAALVDAILITQDDYYKADNPSDPDFNYDHPSAFDNELLYSHLKALSDGMEVDSPIYDYSIHKRSSETKRLVPCPVIIAEGILILENEKLRSLFDLTVFVDTSEEERFARRLRRDVKKRARTPESVEKQLGETVKPMHDLYVEPTKAYADRIIVGGGKDPEAIKILTEMITEIQKYNREKPKSKCQDRQF